MDDESLASANQPQSTANKASEPVMKPASIIERPSEPNPKLAAQYLTEGLSITKALYNAGYSEASSLRGIAGVPKKVFRLMRLAGGKNLIALGQINVTEQEQLVRGRLVLNTLQGKDQGVNSAYRLGQDKRLNMFQSENQVGIVVMNMPKTVDSLLE